VCVFSVKSESQKKIEGTLFARSAKYARDVVDLNRAIPNVDTKSKSEGKFKNERRRNDVQ
jgi:hypothetical protein